MKNIIGILNYNENFVEKVIKEIFPIYELWNIRALDDLPNVLTGGRTKDIARFSDFIKEHADKDESFELVIYVGYGWKNHPTIMLNATVKALKVNFDKL